MLDEQAAQALANPPALDATGNLIGERVQSLPARLNFKNILEPLHAPSDTQQDGGNYTCCAAGQPGTTICDHKFKYCYIDISGDLTILFQSYVYLL